MPEGETPHTISLCVYEGLVDYVKPGDRVEVTGLYRCQGVRVNPNRRTMKNVYRTYVDVVSFVKGDKKRFGVDLNSDKSETINTNDLGLRDEHE